MSNRAKQSPDSPAARHGRAWTVAACLMIVAAGLAAYSNSFQVPFIFDDVPSICENPTIRHVGSLDFLTPPEETTVARRPILNFSFAATYAIGGLDVRPFHAGNVLIHLLAALTLFGIVRRTLRTPA